MSKLEDIIPDSYVPPYSNGCYKIHPLYVGSSWLLHYFLSKKLIPNITSWWMKTSIFRPVFTTPWFEGRSLMLNDIKTTPMRFFLPGLSNNLNYFKNPLKCLLISTNKK